MNFGILETMVIVRNKKDVHKKRFDCRFQSYPHLYKYQICTIPFDILTYIYPIVNN